jgi:Site-specific recombinases, DNA invertase Pin homologs
MTNKTRVALYARSAVVTSGTAEKTDAQLAELKACCDDRGWIIVEQYHDAGRPEGEALRVLLEAAHSTPRPFDVVMVRDINRISRQLDEVMAFRRSLDALGIELAVLESGGDFATLAEVRFPPGRTDQARP